MGFTTAAAMAMQAVGTVQASQAQRAAGDAQRDAAYYSGTVMDQQAGQARATAQRVAIQERRKANLLQSTAIARAAASGGSATDPTVTNLVSGIAGQGEYNALTALFNGEEKARGLENQADLTRYEGEQAAYAGRQKAKATLFSGFGTILGSKGAASLYDKYGSPGNSMSDIQFNEYVDPASVRD
jgi:hypothetical protein